MRRIAYWFATLMLLPGLALAQGYQVLDRTARTSNPDAVEIYEFFSYACQYCYTFRPRLEEWAEHTDANVEVTRVPVVFRPSWRPLAKAYFAAEALDAVDKIHAPLFDAIHAENRNLQSESQLIDFFVEQGLPREDVEAAFKSFTVDVNMRRAQQLATAYKVTSTPTVGVEGKYVLNPSISGGQEVMIRQLDALVAKEAK